MLTATLFVSSVLAGSALAAPQFGRRATHTIEVGADGQLKFGPEAIFAETGDIVEFVFKSNNFSIFQSSFAEPCTPLEGGFRSDFQFVDEGTAEEQLPVVPYTVTAPKEQALWFYGRQGGGAPSACREGMLFAINCPSTGQNTFENFVRKATGDPSATYTGSDVPPAPTATDVITVLAPEPEYEGVTYPAYTTPEVRTDVITLGSESWTTTYASFPGSPKPTPESEDGNVIQILVGTDGNPTFSPPYTIAYPRDTLVFTFQGGNYSIVQSSFAAPCSPYTTADGKTGINSGYFQVTEGGENPTYSVKVNNTTPLYFYSGQTEACGEGMVFAVNTDEEGARSSDAFRTLAIQVNGTEGEDNTGDEADSASRASFAGLAIAGTVAAVAAFLL